MINLRDLSLKESDEGILSIDDEGIPKEFEYEKKEEAFVELEDENQKPLDLEKIINKKNETVEVLQEETEQDERSFKLEDIELLSTNNICAFRPKKNPQFKIKSQKEVYQQGYCLFKVRHSK